MDDDQLYTVTEAAALLNVSRSTIYRLLAAGDLASTRVGHRLRIPAAAIRDLIEAGMQKATL